MGVDVRGVCVYMDGCIDVCKKTIVCGVDREGRTDVREHANRKKALARCEGARPVSGFMF